MTIAHAWQITFGLLQISFLYASIGILSAQRGVTTCLSVCRSVTAVYCSETAECSYRCYYYHAFSTEMWPGCGFLAPNMKYVGPVFKISLPLLEILNQKGVSITIKRFKSQATDVPSKVGVI